MAYLSGRMFQLGLWASNTGIEMKRLLILVTMTWLLASCGGGSNKVENIAPVLSGVFINSPAKGILYETTSGLNGVTDVNGSFNYRTGDTVTFSLDLGSTKITLGSIVNPNSTTSVLSLNVPSGGDPLSIAQILQTLDRSSIDGKLDLSGISVPAGHNVISSIINATKSSSISHSNIGSIAADVQGLFSISNQGSLKYGVSGVRLSQAISNLAKHPVNQPLVSAKISSTAYDGSSTFLSIVDKPFYIAMMGRDFEGRSWFEARMGVLKSDQTYEFRRPSGNFFVGLIHGTYSLSSDGSAGSYNGRNSSPDNGRLIAKNSDFNTFTFSVESDTNNTSTSAAVIILEDFSVADVLGKSFIVKEGCLDGSDNLVSVNSNGLASDLCHSRMNGSRWEAGYHDNVLKYTDTQGYAHFIGIVKLNKNSGVGNFPSGAVGTFVDIFDLNRYIKPSLWTFVVH